MFSVDCLNSYVVYESWLFLIQTISVVSISSCVAGPTSVHTEPVAVFQPQSVGYLEVEEVEQVFLC